MPDEHRHCIVTALSREKLDAQVFELIRQGWRPLGNVAAAKPVSESAPPYFCQSMIWDAPSVGASGPVLDDSGDAPFQA